MYKIFSLTYHPFISSTEKNSFDQNNAERSDTLRGDLHGEIRRSIQPRFRRRTQRRGRLCYPT